MAGSSPPPSQPVHLRIVHHVALLASAGLVLAVATMADPIRLANVLTDDAFYYFKTALNFASTGSFTYDGIHATNGFHPLWQYLLSALALATRATGEPLLRLVIACEATIGICCSLLLFDLLRRAYAVTSAALTGIVANVLFFGIAVIGLETALMLLALLAFSWLVFRFFTASQHTLKNAVAVGVVLGLVELSRLDLVFLGVALYAHCIVLAWRGSRGVRWRHVAAALAANLVVVTPYLCYNQIAFGRMMPISGALKSSFPHPGLWLDTLNALRVDSTLGLLAALLFVVVAAVSPRRLATPIGAVTLYLSIAVLLHFAHTVLFMKWAVFGWHYAPYTLLLLLAVAPAIARADSALQRRRWSVPYAVTLLALVLALVSVTIIHRRLTRPLDTFATMAYRAGLWLRDNSDPSTIAAMKDSGVFAYFCQRRVLSLDGLMNDFEYQSAIRDQQLTEYLARQGVAYLAQHAFFDDPAVDRGDYVCTELAYRSHLYEATALVSACRPNEVYRSDAYPTSRGATRVVIWKMPSESGAGTDRPREHSGEEESARHQQSRQEAQE